MWGYFFQKHRDSDQQLNIGLCLGGGIMQRYVVAAAAAAAAQEENFKC